MAEYRINYTQSNFTGGIIAAELYGRNDFNKVKSGLKKCTNWTIREAGGLEFRRGTRYHATLPSEVNGQFKVASLDTMVFFFCEDGIRYYDNEWKLLSYPEGAHPSLAMLQFTELNRKLYYYDSFMPLCEIGLYRVASSVTISQTVGESLTDIAVDKTTLEAYIGTTDDVTLVFVYDGTAEEWKTGGANWTPTTQVQNLGNYYWRNIAWDGTKFVAISGSGYISTSTDGINWTPAVQDINLGSYSWYGIAWDGNKFVALGETGYISTSTDGANWTPAVQDTNLGDNSWRSICWDGNKFVALGETGYISTSTDGTNWTPATQIQNLGNNVWRDIVWDGNKFVALYGRGGVSTSTDGTNWTPATQIQNLGRLGWEAIAWDGNKFVALSDVGYISTSTDGTNWTPATKNTNLGNNAWRSICWNGSKFVAIASGGYISTSTDGATWSVAPQPSNPGNFNMSTSTDVVTVQLSDYGITYSGDPVDTDEITLVYKKEQSSVPQTEITKFESAPSEATLSSELQGAAPDVHVDVLHEYTFALATDENHESIVSDLTTSQTANVELSQASTSGDNKAQQIDVTVTLTNDLLNKYDGGKVLFYKKYQGYFYFLSALDLEPETLVYTYEDKGQNEVDTSKTPKKKPTYLQADGSIEGVNSIADYNQRLFLTRADQESTHIIFSETGNVDSLAYTLQRNEDEAGYLELPISNYDSWCKVVSGLDLILSTSYTLSRVSGYGDLTTETVLWDGFSKTVNPVRTRRSLIYTNSSNRNIYDLTYNEYGQYDSIDLTLLVKYIFETKTIKRLSFKDYPVKTIYVLCDDGDLYCLTYIKDQNIYAWYKLEHTGTIIDMCIVNTALEDEIYLVVKYGDEYIVERAYHRTDSIYMDCCVTRQLTEIENNTITGLDIFEGMTVRVFDAGNNLYYGDYDIMNPQTTVEGGKVVEIDDLTFNGFTVSNGQITLPSDVVLEGPIIIGLPYYAVMETIPLEFQDSNGNSTIGRKKAVNEAYLRYGDSRGLTYKTMGHEYDCGICSKDVEDNAQFLERGQVKLHTTSEYKWDSTIKILQRQPYPARIESVTLGITFNDKS